MTIKALGVPIAVPVGPSGFSVSGVTTVLSDGTLLVGGASGPNSQLYLEHFSAGGVKLGDVFEDIPNVPGFGFTGSTVRGLTGGGFAVVFQFDNGNSRTQLYARAYSVSGVPTSDAVHLNPSLTDDSQHQGAYLLATANGGYFTDYIDGSQSQTSLSPLITTSTPIESNFASESYDLHGRFLSATGAITADTLLTPGTKIAPGSGSGPYAAVAGDQESGQPAQLANGSVVVPYFDADFYTHTDGDGITRKDANNTVSARLVTPSGISTTIRVNSAPLPDPGNSFVYGPGGTNAVALSNGGFAVVWQTRSTSGSTSFDNRLVRFFDSSGSATTGDINILQFPTAPVSGVGLVALKSGGFAMAYETYSQANKHDVYVETVTTSGAVDQTFAVATSADDELLQDLAAAPNGSFYVTLDDVFGSGTGILTQHFGTPSVPLHDVNADGTSDVLLQSGSTVVDWIVKNGQYQSGTVLANSSGYSVVGSGDFNADGTADVLLQSGSSVVDWLLQNGTYQSGNVLANSSGYKVVGTGDFNADGTSDVLLQSGSSVVDWILKNGAYQSGNVLANSSGYQVVGTGDFNGDGTSDVLLQSGNSVVDWILKNGAYQSGNVLANSSGYLVVGTGDFNGDGTTDVLLQNGSSVIDWILGNGAYQTGNVIANSSGYAVVGTGDYNGDGTTDILLQNGSSVVQWTMQNGAYQSGAVLANSSGFAVKV